MFATKMSPFQIPPHTTHIQGIFQVTLSDQIDGVLTGLAQIQDDIPQWNQTEQLVL